jgi:hypothetical protein
MPKLHTFFPLNTFSISMLPSHPQLPLLHQDADRRSVSAADRSEGDIWRSARVLRRFSLPSAHEPFEGEKRSQEHGSCPSSPIDRGGSHLARYHVPQFGKANIAVLDAASL